MSASIRDKIEQALDAKITHSKPLAGGDIADVSCLTLSDDRRVVAKRPRMDQPDTTACEKMMLQHLGKMSNLPVPDVLYQTKGALIISYIEHTATTDDPQTLARDAAQHIAAMHAVRPRKKATPYGFEKDTFIGPLPQQNKQNKNWVNFFRDHRLLAMASSCLRTQRIPKETMQRIEKLSDRLPDIIPAKPAASLLHGDLWSGNILFDGNSIAGFIDPAVSYGHSEMDLAFIALMGGLDASFFDAYNAVSLIEENFFEERCPLYQLWPLLVHTRIFGGGYIDQVHERLTILGV